MLLSISRSALTIVCTALVLSAPIAETAHAQSLFDKVKSGLGINKETVETLSQADIAQGLKEALEVGTKTVVSQLGALDGFNNDPQIHIPLPPKLTKAKSLLAKIGLASLGDDLELELNRAAEVATPKAKDLFLKAIKDMTLDDVTAIYKGPEDAATQYFRGKMTPDLQAEMQPIINESLSAVGALTTYDEFMRKYDKLPFVPDIKNDLNDFVMEKTLDGIFYYVAQEEAAIRSNPLKQTTNLLKKVFGGAE